MHCVTANKTLHKSIFTQQTAQWVRGTVGAFATNSTMNAVGAAREETAGGCL